MKASNISTIDLLTAIIFSGSVFPAFADNILTVDISNPAAVTFTGISNAADSNQSNSLGNGLTLVGFFSGNTNSTPSDPSDPVASGSFGVLSQNLSNGARHSLNQYYIGIFDPGNWTRDDIFFGPTSGSGSIYARTDSQAVTGGVTLNLTGYPLPSLGHSGNVILGPPDNPRVIGQFIVQNATAELSVSINQAAGQLDPSDDSAINFTAVFSDPVSNFTTGDVTLGGTAGPTSAVVTGSGTTYNVAVSGMTNDGTVIASIGAGVASTSGGLANSASTSTDNQVVRNTAGPSISVDISNPSAVVFTGLAVSSFISDSGSAGNGITLQDFFDGNTVTTGGVDAVPVSSGSLNVLNQNSSSGTRGALNQYFIGDFSPGVWTKDDIFFGPPTSASGSLYARTDSQAATGSVTLDLSGYVLPAIGHFGKVLISSPDSQKVIGQYRVIDPAPALTVSINQASGQQDPTDESTIDFTVVFSDSVSDFATGDVTVFGTAGATTAIVTGSGTTYNVAVSGMTNDGTVLASIPAAVASTGGGMDNTPSLSTDNQVAYNTAGPAITIDVTNPAAVVFTGQSAPAFFNESTTAANGIAVLDFFNGNSMNTGPGTDPVAVASGSLSTLEQNSSGGSRRTLDTYSIVDFPSGGWTTDDVFFGPTLESGFLYARTDTQAFSGMATLDLTGFTLPSSGHTGDIVIDSPDKNKVIGRYLVTAGENTPTHYVSSAGSNTWPYDTPARAATNIQSAVDSAIAGDTVIVADGTYSTGSRTLSGELLANRVVIDKAITLRSENGAAQTTITGSFGTGTSAPIGPDSIRGVHLSGGAILDGFTISGGSTTSSLSGDLKDSSGGGILIVGTGTVTNCTITGCRAHIFGGGIFNTPGGAIVSNCNITSNSTLWATISQGGGAYLSGSTLSETVFSNNFATTAGGGFYATDSDVSGCTASSNGLTSALGDGGGGYATGASTVDNCTFFSNNGDEGAGLYINGEGSVSDSIFSGNIAVANGGGLRSLGSTQAVSGCKFYGNTAARGGGMRSDDGSQRLTRCEFSGNSATISGGGLFATDDNMIVDNCLFSGNSAGDYGGGATIFWGAATNCTFSSNKALNEGGGLASTSMSSPMACQNSIFWNNLAGLHTTTRSASVHQVNSGTFNFKNCIVANSGGSLSWNFGAQYIDLGNNLDVNPSLIHSPPPSSAPSQVGDFRLLVGSIALNFGDNLADLDASLEGTDTIAGVATGLGGNARIQNTAVDLGPYEGSNLATFALLHPLLDPDSDANLNGLTNYGDYAAGADPTAPHDPNVIPQFNGSQIVFPFRNNASDVFPIYQKSITLLPGSWSKMNEGSDYDIHGFTNIGPLTLLTIDLLNGATSGSKIYFRGKYSDGPPEGIALEPLDSPPMYP